MANVQAVMVDMLKKVLEVPSQDQNLLAEMVKSFAKMINDKEDETLNMSSIPPEVVLTCSVCKNPASRYCQRCAMMYCSTECREKDWRGIHRFVCLSSDDSFNANPDKDGGDSLSLEQKRIVNQMLNDNKLPVFSRDEKKEFNHNLNGSMNKTPTKSSVKNVPAATAMPKVDTPFKKDNKPQTKFGPVKDTQFNNDPNPTTFGRNKDQRSPKKNSFNGEPKQETSGYQESFQNGHCTGKENVNSTRDNNNRRSNNADKFNARDHYPKKDSSNTSVSSNSEKKQNHVTPKNFPIRNTSKKSLLGDYVAPANEPQISEALCHQAPLDTPEDAGFAAQRSEVGSTIELTVKMRQDVTSFVCIGVPKFMENDYSLFKKELNEAVKSTNHIMTRKRDFISCLAVTKGTNDSSWNRALFMVAGYWRLIDAGEVTKKDDKHSWKTCPPMCSSMPHRSCLLTVNNPKNTLEVGQTYTCTVTCVDEPTEVLVQIKTSYTTLYGKLTQWTKLFPPSEDSSPNNKLPGFSPISKEAPVNDCTKKKLFVETSPPNKMKYNINNRQSNDKMTYPKNDNVKSTRTVTCQTLGRLIVKDGDIVTIVKCGPSLKPLIRIVTKEKIFEYENIVDSIAQYGVDAKPLEMVPLVDDLVVVRYNVDGIYYRGVVKSYKDTSSGTVYTVRLLDICELISAPISEMRDFQDLEIVCHSHTIAQLDLNGLDALPTDLMKPSVSDYINNLIKTKEKLVCKRVGKKYLLTVEKTNESVNDRIIEMNAAEWQQIIEKGDDIVTTTPVYMLDMIEYQTLKSNDILVITDNSELKSGSLFCILGEPEFLRKLDALNEQMAKYCNKVTNPYMPRLTELCIAKFGEDGQWYRAFMMGSSGEDSVFVLFLDYGNTTSCNFTDIRKMMPEFVEALPAQACCCHIKDFNEDPKKYTDQAENLLNTGSCLTLESLEFVENGNYNISLSVYV